MLLLLLLLGQLTLEAPASVTANQPFSVRLKGAVGQTAYLYVLEERASVRLEGTVQAVVQPGQTIFPEVRLKADPDFAGSLRLVTVVLTGDGSQSAVSLPVQVQSSAATVTLQDRAVGIIGATLSWDHAVVSLEEVFENGPAARAGLEGGDQLVSVDGQKVAGLEDAFNALRGAPGTRVAVTVQRDGKPLTLTVERVAQSVPPVEFAPIAYQASLSPFQTAVVVVDDAGAPLAGAQVTVRLDPAWSKESLLFLSTATQLSDASGNPTTELTAVTGGDGRATLWVRLYNAATPFDARLTATASYRGHTSGVALSNVFRVYRR